MRFGIYIIHTITHLHATIWIDDKLKFTDHIGHAVAKSNQILGLIKRFFVDRDFEIIERLFTALVRPHLEYANSV